MIKINYFNLKSIWIFIIIFIFIKLNENIKIVISSTIKELDCHDVYISHFSSNNNNNNNKYLQVTVINPQGVVSFSRDAISYITKGNYITNVKLFPTVFSNGEQCVHSQLQPFSFDKKKISFGDRNGIIISPDGTFTYKPIWSTVGELKFNYSCDKNIYYGWSKSHFISFSFITDHELGSPCTNP
ncbi:hypothetical protein ACTFIW_000330 [Dictyostelium discoideum]